MRGRRSQFTGLRRRERGELRFWKFLDFSLLLEYLRAVLRIAVEIPGLALLRAGVAGARHSGVRGGGREEVPVRFGPELRPAASPWSAYSVRVAAHLWVQELLRKIQNCSGFRIRSDAVELDKFWKILKIQR